MKSNKLINLFASILDRQAILSDIQVKQTYETDWRNRYHGLANLVLLPENTAQIRQIIRLCKANKIAIIPQGGNTSLCGASVPTVSAQTQVIINLKRLNKILSLDTATQTITVAAGCTLKQVADYAKEHNLYFPLSIASEGSCQIGGNVATNAGGIHVVKYGMIRNMVLGLEAVLADGSIIDQSNTLIKNNTYLDLKQLFIGSEGTLGIITKVNLKLFPLPQAYCTVLLGVIDLSICLNLFRILKAKFNLCAFEVINKTTQTLYNNCFIDKMLPITNEWLILFELETALEFNVDSLIDIFSHQQITLDQIIIATTTIERNNLWSFREQIPLAEKMAGFAIKHDIGLPLGQIEAFLHQNKVNLLQRFPQINIIVFGHLGDGNLHYNIQFPGLNLIELEQVEKEVNEIVYSAIYAFKGTFSAEHGIGQLKASWYHKCTDPTTYNTAKLIKQTLDPENLFNPGKIFTE